MKRLTVLILALTLSRVYAQPTVGNFQLTDVVSGEVVSLDRYRGKPVAVVFTSNNCPYDNYYQARIAALVGQYGDRVAFLFVNAHLDAQEDEVSMKKKASSWGFSAPYLADKTQAAMEALGAHRSPEVFLLKPGGADFTVVYSGAIDDSPQEEAAVASAYFRNALTALLSGQTAPAAVRAVGCSIRRK